MYGFVMVDAIHDFQRMDPDWDDAFRPSKIPTTEGQFGGDGQSSVSVKQSRFGIKGSMPTGEGNTPLTFKFDFDLFGTGDNAGQTTFRLQNAYGEWGSLLAGQTDSLFMDIDVFPNTIDYWGPPGMVFYRNVQIRWTPFRTDNSHFAIAIERPGNDIDGGNVRLIEGFEDAEIQNDEELPDLTAQWRIGGDWGHLQPAGSCAGSDSNSARPPTMSSGTATRRAGASTSAPRSTRSATTCCCCRWCTARASRAT